MKTLLLSLLLLTLFSCTIDELPTEKSIPETVIINQPTKPQETILSSNTITKKGSVTDKLEGGNIPSEKYRIKISASINYIYVDKAHYDMVKIGDNIEIILSPPILDFICATEYL